ncbi:hypothetical protein J2Y45_003118 [Dyadobacter sp. BE34]|uniref:Uncharacterized protein n=1 Tax=Dyadobacter fermentans TaxID=94254 RepID=A0ABU1QTV3_9BACT|nr:hypothetical protein [Dyadobacter fermentans]MDR7043667.1 hypothetical protein [Dyadobacter sp. BE242]MDR7197979.1 hypothetical protein [Dyadobacter sp. BE34]MDR7214587.1 hypothetical protein [Dyadobacter sp. BE31]MDR7262122.1 hypothetical protein [Dyadobacter sp. BE32]
MENPAAKSRTSKESSAGGDIHPYESLVARDFYFDTRHTVFALRTVIGGVRTPFRFCQHLPNGQDSREQCPALAKCRVSLH